MRRREDGSVYVTIHQDSDITYIEEEELEWVIQEFNNLKGELYGTTDV